MTKFRHPALRLIAAVLVGCGVSGFSAGHDGDTITRDADDALLYFEPVDPPESDGKDTLTNVVDILVAYDAPAAKWLEEGGWTAEGFAELQVARMNAVLADSGLLDDFRFRLTGVRTLTVSVKSLGKSNTTRFLSVLDKLDTASQLEMKAGSGYDGVIEARYSCGADIAVVLAHTGSTNGTLGASYGLRDSKYGWNSKENLAYCGRRAFSVCEIAAVEAGYVMTHEVGHVLGAGHPGAGQVNPEKLDTGPQLFDYSSAYLFDYAGERYYTVMGYSFDGYGGSDFRQIGVFSSPELTYRHDGADTGVPLGVEGLYDNVRTIRNSFQYVAKYRTHTVPDESGSEIGVTVKTAGGGTAGGGGLYYAGEQVSLDARAASGYLFGGWYELVGEGVTNAFSQVADHRAEKCSFIAGTNSVVLLARFVRKDKDLDPVGSVTPLFGMSDFRAGEPYRLSPALTADSQSRVTFTASGLPAGLKFDSETCMLSGKPTKPGSFKVLFTAKNQSGATAQTNVTVTVGNWRDDALPLDESYGPFVPGVAVRQDFSAFACGCAVSGLPSGMKWTKKTGLLSGAPSKPGVNTVVFTRTDADAATGKKVSRKASATFIVGPYPVLTLRSDGAGHGKLSGAGAYAANKKVSLKAVQDAKSKSVFAGWWTAEGELLSLESSWKFTMPPVDTEVLGRFVTREEDISSIKASLGGEVLSETEPLVLTNLCGVAFSRSLEATALSRTSVSVSGLPGGLKFTAKSGTIRGVFSKTSSLDRKTGAPVPFRTIIKVTTTGKNVRTYSIDSYVMPLPAWAVGTFDGGGDVLTATLTSQKTGKLSGKMQESADVWTLSAPSFCSGEYDGVHGAADLKADLVRKCGRVVVTNTVCFLPDGVSGIASNELFTVARNPWSAAEYKSFAKKLKALGETVVERDEGVFTFRFTAAGTATVAARFKDGYSASASAPLVVLAPPGPDFAAYVFLRYPPRSSKGFAGYDARVLVRSDGTAADVNFTAEDLTTQENTEGNK